jgi:hypothetical protein
MGYFYLTIRRSGFAKINICEVLRHFGKLSAQYFFNYELSMLNKYCPVQLKSLLLLNCQVGRGQLIPDSYVKERTEKTNFLPFGDERKLLLITNTGVTGLAEMREKPAFLFP